MSPQRTSHEGELAKFREAGFQVEIKESHLLVTNVPYVAPDGRVRRGSLVDPVGGDGKLLGVPPRHTIWWIGEHPHRADGTKLASIEHSQGAKKLSDSIHADHMFSARPKPNDKYDSYIHKYSTYYDIISRHAFEADPSLKPTEAGLAELDLDPRPFKYLDTASSRAEIVAISNKVRGQQIAIVGLGGTGSYVLDLVAKTPIAEIHLFDGDSIERHNAFRSPGAIAEDEFVESTLKVNHYCDRYGVFRDGLVAHAYFIDNDNVGELSAFDFVFLCIDNGPARKLVAEHLVSSDIAFIDVGMGVDRVDDQLIAMMRVTLVTPAHNEHFERCIPFSDNQRNDYDTNIQIAELNSLNAALAVMRWKRYNQVYLTIDSEHDLQFSTLDHETFKEEND